MRNNVDYWCSYAYYDERGRRLSAFARNTGAGDVEIYIFTYSKQEKRKFSKQRALEMYLDWNKPEVLYDPVENTCPSVCFVDIARGKTARSVFLEYMENNYYRAHPLLKVHRVLACVPKGELLNKYVGEPQVFQFQD